MSQLNESLIHADGATLPTLLRRWSTIEPETPAYIFVGEQTRTVLSRREVFTLAGKMSARLHGLGVCKGDVIANMLPNSPERLVCDFGILMCGGISQTALGYLNNADDTFGALEIAQTTTIIINPSDKTVCSVLDRLFSKSKVRDYGLEVHCSRLPSLRRVIYVQYENGNDIREQLQEGDIYMEDVKPWDYAVIVETSGTTGVCKQIPHTHSSIVRFGEQMCFLIGKNGSPFYNDRYFGWFPGFPCVYPSSGITRVVLDARNENLPAILNVIRREGCRSAYLVPSEIEEVIHAMEASQCNIQPLEVVLTGGQPISKKSTRILNSFTKSVVCRYGMSETMCICYLSVTSQEEFEDHCVGYPMPSYQVRVVDNVGSDVAVGNQGVILVKGDGVFSGYLGKKNSLKVDSNGYCIGTDSQNSPNEHSCDSVIPKCDIKHCLNRDAFTSDGWFHTDDVGFFNSEGQLFVHGRGSDAIMHGDEILYPFWLEKLASGCPAIEDIAIVPVTDPVVCHEICACIIPSSDCVDPVAAVKSFMTQQFAVVRHEECSIMPKFYLLFDTFPLNKNKKLNRKELSRLAENRLQS